MRLKNLEINGFKSFAQKTTLEFISPIVCIVGPNGSGKSNVVEAIRFVLGEQSMKSMRGKLGTDLIFKGSKNLSKGSRANVSIYFNNSDKVFKLSNENGENVDLNYETVSISREVYADGLNKYVLNNSDVRLKDVHNLLASVNVGSSGHHIISQGEADRILNANGKERREMIEDALGLKIYQYKIKESERKLEKTGQNMKEVSLVRRENVPHLNFLKKQVEKFEKAKEMQVELLFLYREYLKRESVYLEREKNILQTEKTKISLEWQDINLKISQTEKQNDNNFENKKVQDLKILENKISEIRNVKGEMERKLGRIEGMIEMEEHQTIVPARSFHANISVDREDFESFLKEMREYLEEAMYMDVLENIAPLLKNIEDILNRFARNFENEKQSEKQIKNLDSQLSDLKNTQSLVMAEMAEIVKKEKEIIDQIGILQQEINNENVHSRELERKKFNLRVRHQELSSILELNAVKEQNLSREIEIFENEIKEGSVIIGVEILSYKNFLLDEVLDKNLDKNTREEQRRKIERIKIKLEDIGANGGAEVMKEFQEVSERDQFLGKEMEDLAQSMESLKKLMSDLKEKIDLEFKEGIKKINIEFQAFFALMFGGGSANLSVIVENKRKKDEALSFANDGVEDLDGITFEQGIEINVSLPHKKVKELHALSGGERSLTSIALLFAMSQVNPPPFLVLDETDAALDESNSRKYGDMLEKLSKHSQLIVVTHNRETMSRAGVLYGVTIGADGASKLLSVKFDEAQIIAK